jgi:hypothetical protein
MADIPFATAQEMFDHLASMIADQHVVTIAVQQHFPDFRRPAIRLVTKKAELFRAPIDDTFAHDTSQRLAGSAMAMASKDLLHAIHKAHPAIMNTLAAQGRTVVYP